MKRQHYSETDNISVINGDLAERNTEEIEGMPSMTESLADLPVDDCVEIKGGRVHDNGIKVYIDVVYNHTD